MFFGTHFFVISRVEPLGKSTIVNQARSKEVRQEDRLAKQGERNPAGSGKGHLQDGDSKATQDESQSG